MSLQISKDTMIGVHTTAPGRNHITNLDKDTYVINATGEVKEKEHGSEASKEESARRARQNMQHYALAYPAENTRFLTLTKKEFLTEQQFKKEMKAFLFGLGLKDWIGTFEFQKRGALHAHLLVFNCPNYLSYSKANKAWGGSARWEELKGKNPLKYLAYICKYISKNTADEKITKQTFFRSRNGLKHLEKSNGDEIEQTEVLERQTIPITRPDGTTFEIIKTYFKFKIKESVGESRIMRLTPPPNGEPPPKPPS